MLKSGTTGGALDDAVAARTDAAFDFLARLVAQPSEVGREAGAIAELGRELEGLGFATSVLPIPSGVVEDPAAGVPIVSYTGDRGPLVARLPATREGAGARSLLLNGHLDVVPPGSASGWSGDPFEPHVEDGWMVGRGAGDMKGGIAMAVLATGALLDVVGQERAGDLTFVGAIEEECGGNGTLAAVHAGVLADAAVLTEPTDLDLLNGGIGVLWLELTVSGPGGHAETGGDSPSALDVAAALLPVLRDLEARIAACDDRATYRVNVGAIHGGEWTSSVPTSATLSVRVGFPSDWSASRAEAWVRASLRELADSRPELADQRIAIRSSGMRAEGYALPASNELIRTLQGVHAGVHGTSPAVVSSSATTDARFYVNQARMPAVCFGPRARGLHAADESVELESIVQGARTLSRFMAVWLTGDQERSARFPSRVQKSEENA